MTTRFTDDELDVIRDAATAAELTVAIALAGHTTAPGAPVWYSGGKLAADLSLPRIRCRAAQR